MRHPDIRERHFTQRGHVLDHPHDAEPLPIRLQRVPHRGAIAEETLSRPLVDDRHEAGLVDVARRVGCALDEAERQNVPELAVGVLERRTDGATGDVGAHRADRRREDRQALDAGQPAGMAIEQREARAAAQHAPGDGERRAVHAQGPVLIRLRRDGAEHVVEHRRRHHQHEEREADADEADAREELAPQEHLDGDREVVWQHGRAPGVN